MRGKTLYLECYSGISGDMTVAALLDLGADEQVLRQALGSLKIGGFEIEISRVKKSGLDACDFCVKLDAAHENHDHDMQYLYGHAHGHEAGTGHAHGHEEDTGHVHGHEHGHDGHEHMHQEAHTGHAHEHRGLGEIMEILSHADITERARETAVRIFTILGEAEAKAHGVPIEQVHFHEVGAVDSVVDILSAAVCLDDLDITEVIVPKLCEGRGTVRCQHGILPVPVPAVANIAEAYKLPLQITETEGELVTPTGAAIAAAVRTSGVLPEEFIIERTGIGAGKRTYDRPSLLRAMLIAGKSSAEKTEQNRKTDRVFRLETNVDDCTGETLGYVMDKLLCAGARDVHYTPVFMKKNRPAYQLNVICDRGLVEKMEEILFKETTTIGIRKTEVERSILPREIRIVDTPLGEAKVKLCTLRDGEKRAYPEYESVAALAEKHQRAFMEVYHLVMESFRLLEE